MLTIYKRVVELPKRSDNGLKRLKRFDKFFDRHPELLHKKHALVETPELAEPLLNASKRIARSQRCTKQHQPQL